MFYLSKLYLKAVICLLLTLLINNSGRAEQEELVKEDRPAARAEMRQRMLDEFDVDGDGELSEDERTTARQAMRSRRGDRAGRAKAAKGSRGAGSKGAGSNGARQGGEGLRGAEGPPDPARLFDQYDANGDGQLNREEFMKLTAAVRASRPPQAPGQRGGPRPGGPPREGRRQFDGQRPLQNPGDRPGPPPPREGRRHLLDDDGPDAEAGGPGVRRPGRAVVADRRSDGRQNADRLGPGRPNPGRPNPGRRGFDRQGPPDPARMFEHFDENGDDQLSRAEFMKLADRMREMRDRFGPGGERGDQDAGNDRGPRRRPPREGDDIGRPRGRRPQRPELQAPPEAQRHETDAAAIAAPRSDDAGADAVAAADDDAV